MFVGSPVKATEQELVRLGARMKKNQVAVDIVNFGEEATNKQKLEAFINAVNSSDNRYDRNFGSDREFLSNLFDVTFLSSHNSIVRDLQHVTLGRK
jgi:hypothetical protein